MTGPQTRTIRQRRRSVVIAGVIALLMAGGAVAYSAVVLNPDPCDSKYIAIYQGLRNYPDCRLDLIDRAIPQVTVTVPGPTTTVAVTPPSTSVTSPTKSPPVTVSVRDFGATGNSSDESAQIQAALNSGAQVVTLGSTGTFRAAVSVPAGVTFESAGAGMIPVNGSAVLSSGGNGAVIRNIGIDTSAVAGHHTILVSHSGVHVSGVRVTGDGYRYGVLIENTQTRLSDVAVEYSTFTHTSYGILKQTTDLDNARVTGNTFRDTRRGDAIEWNKGHDTGTQIVNNNIDGVHMDGTGYGGLGIGVAGAGSYNQPLDNMTSGYTISGNTVKNAESEAIHLEKMRDTLIENNYLEQTANPRSATGIVFYGSSHITARGNTVISFDVGIWDAWGVINGQYVPIDGQNVIENNTIRR
ncbi:MAG: NosD domain-containing protein [Dermatophilaceae bacterium]